MGMQSSSEHGLCARQARHALEARGLAVRQAGQAQLWQACKLPRAAMPRRTVRRCARGGAAAFTGSGGAAQTHPSVQGCGFRCSPLCSHAPSRDWAGMRGGAGACKTRACPPRHTRARHAARRRRRTRWAPPPRRRQRRRPHTGCRCWRAARTPARAPARRPRPPPPAPARPRQAGACAAPQARLGPAWPPALPAGPARRSAGCSPALRPPHQPACQGWRTARAEGAARWPRPLCTASRVSDAA